MLIWLAIVFCISQSAMFSGLNLALFSFSRLRLEIIADLVPEKQAENIRKIIKIRSDSNFLLTTILWGNVGINVLLTLLTDSVLAGVASFFFSTFAITIFGEIFPQAYFSRNALTMALKLYPVIRFYQFLLYPVAKPMAILLDKWLGKEQVRYFRDVAIRAILKKHVEAGSEEVPYIEGAGAINFLSLREIPVSSEGEPLDPHSILTVHTEDGVPRVPAFEPSVSDPFIRRIHRSEMKWIVFQDTEENPVRVLDADGFIRAALFSERPVDIHRFMHAPTVCRDGNTTLDTILMNLMKSRDADEDAPIKKDLVLFWSKDDKRIITGADILGRLLRHV